MKVNYKSLLIFIVLIAKKNLYFFGNFSLKSRKAGKYFADLTAITVKSLA